MSELLTLATGDISMARTNYKCVANIYADFTGKLKPDYVFASDPDYYLSSIGAAQYFYQKQL